MDTEFSTFFARTAATLSIVFLAVIGLIPLILLILLGIGLLVHPLEQGYASAISGWESLTRSTIIALLGSAFQTITAVLAVGWLYSFNTATGSRLTRQFLPLAIMPLTIPPIALALQWRTLLGAEGPVAGIFAWLGWHLPPLLSTRPLFSGHEFSEFNWAQLSILIIDTWTWLPLLIAALLIGIQLIPTEIIDAARVEGGSRSRIYWRITIPMVLDWIMWLWLLRFVDILRMHDGYWVLFRNQSNLQSFSVSVFGLSIGRLHYAEGARVALASVVISTVTLWGIWMLIKARKRLRA